MDVVNIRHYSTNASLDNHFCADAQTRLSLPECFSFQKDKVIKMDAPTLCLSICFPFSKTLIKGK